MLVRSARRAHRQPPSSPLSTAFAQLNLPWLAPAQLRWNASHPPLSPADAERSRKPSVARRPSSSLPRDRQLATAAEPSSLRHFDAHPLPGYSSAFKNSSHDTHIPWDLSKPITAPISQFTMSSHINPVMVDESMRRPPERLKIFNGSAGTSADLVQHLHTTLRVGREERAKDIISRLAEQVDPNSAELRYANMLYFRHALNSIIALPAASSAAQSQMKDIQRWFEVEIRRRGVQPWAELLIVMIRASCHALEDLQRDRSIRRYVEMATAAGEDVYQEVVDSDELDGDEYALVSQNLARQRDLHRKAEAASSEHAQADKGGAVQERSDSLDRGTIPAIESTSMKGSGLEGVQRAMGALTALPALPDSAPHEERQARAYERQRLLEQASVDLAIQRWRDAHEQLAKLGISSAMQSKPMTALAWQWYEALVEALKAELVEVKAMLKDGSSTDPDRTIYGPHLELLPLDITAATVITSCIGILSTPRHNKTPHQATVSHLTDRLGKAIEELAQRTMKRDGKKASGRAKGATQAPASRQARRKTPAKARSESVLPADSAQLDSMSWPFDVRMKIGGLVLSKVVETAQLPVTREHARSGESITHMQPAFVFGFKFERGSRLGVVSLNPALVEKLRSEPVGSLIAKQMPMVVPPAPWTAWDKGGYLHNPSDIMRLGKGDRSGKLFFQAALRNGYLDEVLKGLNALGQVPWKIHQDVFRVQLEAWNSGEAIANLAPANAELEELPAPTDEHDNTARRNWLRELRARENKKIGFHSQRCFQNFQLEVARASINEVLYLPHNLDFRGRAYPIPPYLNHMGADNVRGLLIFAEGKPLGEKGLEWLKVHLATVAGHDKASFSDRLNFTEEHLDDIYDSARDPLGGRRWWLEADDAWQTLAACYELTRALDSPEPTQFISHLPIHQDGTCNGLQHYAALGGDEAGARQVNLEPGERPSDIYTAVADKVRESVNQDAATGDSVAQFLQNNITRKLVKQTVMTNVYGVTYYGAAQQVRKQLEDIFPDHPHTHPLRLGVLAKYISTKIFKSLGEMFSGARDIQAWLGLCAERISMSLTPDQIQRIIAPSSEQIDDKPAETKKSTSKKKKVGWNRLPNRTPGKDAKARGPSFQTPVVWTTPLGLPVVQPYRKPVPKIISTRMQGLRLVDPQWYDPVSKKKQLQGFPPNFIHSLDATHMLLSATKCTEVGLTFASIHDSFWTHACDVDTMSVILRDAFIRMHSDDVVGRLREEFMTRYKDSMHLATVTPSPATRKAIRALRAKLKIAATSPKELEMEMERLKLLRSEDIDERVRGEAMVTPASMFAEMESGTDALVHDSAAAMTLGQLPGVNTTERAEATPDMENEAEALEEEDAEADEEMAAEEKSEQEATAEQGRTRAAAKSQGLLNRFQVWMPTEFPPVPVKGTWDVQRLRGSQYFFS